PRVHGFAREGGGVVVGVVGYGGVEQKTRKMGVTDFQYNPKTSSPTLVSDDLISKSDASKVPIVKSSSLTLTPFGETEESKEKSSVEEPLELELKEFPSHLEKLLKFSKLAMRDLQGDIMVPISQRRSDRGTHFCNDQFTRVMIKYEVTHQLATAYHPQTSGQVEAYENSVIFKEMTKKLHDSKIKNRIFNVDDQVLLFNSCLKIFSGKLKTRWSGPFTIIRVFPYGTIELSQPNGLNFKVNGHRVKHYFGGDVPFNVAPDLHTFLMDN
nr:reverse transcriptase domain-containing protein [Tanacetum cinerariifolium]